MPATPPKPKLIIDFREPAPTGNHLGTPGEKIEIPCLQYFKTVAAGGKFGPYYINKFRTPTGDIVCVNSSDIIPQDKEWWRFMGWVRDHTVWDGERETFVGNPRHRIFRRRAVLKQLRTCPFCGLPQQNGVPPFDCSCIDVGTIEFWPGPTDIEIEDIEDEN